VRIDQRKKQLALFALFAVSLAAGLLVIPIPQMERLPCALLDLVHLPSFALLAFFVSQLWVESTSKIWLRRILALILLVSVGYGTEVLQSFVGRTASLQDLLADVSGTAVGICWSWRRGLSSRKGKRILELACLFFLCGGTWFPVSILVDVFNQRREIPILASFESPLEKYRWQFQNSTFERSADFVSHGKWSMKLTMNPARYPSATLYFPFHNWSSYSHLAFDIYNPHETKELILKISDEQHTGDVRDRFHALLTLHHGWSHFKISLSRIAEAPEIRKMDLSRIDKVQFFMRQPTKPAVFYLDHLRLEK